jgi:hypothetical protein
MLLSRAGRLPTGPGADARGISEDYAIIKDQRVGDPARLSPSPPLAAREFSDAVASRAGVFCRVQLLAPRRLVRDHALVHLRRRARAAG